MLLPCVSTIVILPLDGTNGGSDLYLVDGCRILSIHQFYSTVVVHLYFKLLPDAGTV